MKNRAIQAIQEQKALNEYKQARGYILFEGLSKIDKKPIVVIATGFKGSLNAKTGNMLQVYILRSDMLPMQAIHAGEDKSICGDCKHRGDGTGKGRTCYVQAYQGPTAVYKAYKAGKYPRLQDHRVFKGREVRFGAYGDPAAAPVRIWENIARVASAWTGYSHQWKDFPELAAYCMASTETLEEKKEANALGWRTFRVALLGEEKQKGEVVCPASKEAGAKLQCHECLACSGASKGARSDITINLHGGTAVMSNSKALAANLIAVGG